MGNQLNSFPLVISVKEDGQLAATTKRIEQFIGGGFERAARTAEDAGRRINKAFDIGDARRQVEQFGRAIGELKTKSIADPLGIKASAAALNGSTFQKLANDQLAAENGLARQREQYAQERVAQIQREATLAIAAINDRKAAQTAAFQKAEAEGQALIQQQQQRVAEAVKNVAAPSAPQPVFFDPAGAQASATAARTFATSLDQIARAAEHVAVNGRDVTQTDRDQAVAMREAANAASFQANRLEALAVNQARVATAAGEIGTKFNTAGAIVTRSANAQQFAIRNVGQQFGDFGLSVAAGISPARAFGQQAGQLGYALSEMGGKLGAVGAFLTGPWGIALTVAAAVAAPFVEKLFETGEAAKVAELASSRLGDAESTLADIFGKTSSKIAEQTELLRLNARAKAINLRIEAANDANDARAAFRDAGKPSTGRKLAGTLGVVGGALALNRSLFSSGVDQFRGNDPVRALATRGRAALAISDPAAQTKAFDALLRSTETTNFDGSGVDKKAFIEAVSKAAASRANTAISKYIDESLDSGRIAPQLVKPTKTKGTGTGGRTSLLNAQARLDAADNPVEQARAGLAVTKAQNAELLAQGKITEATYRTRVKAAQLEVNQAEGLKKATAAGKAAERAYTKLIDFGKSAGTSIAQISAEFDDQPRLIDRAAAATQKLSDLIADLGQRQPPGFEDLIADAEKAKGIVETGLTKPFRDLVEAQQEQLATGKLILAGRQDEADALGQILQLQRTKGTVTEAERAVIIANTSALKDQASELERQAQFIDIQVRAASDLQSALTDALEKPFAKGSITKLTDALTAGRQRQIAETLSLKLFGGDLGSKVHDALTRNNQPTVQAADALKGSAAKLSEAAAAIASAKSNDPSIASLTTTPTAYGASPAGVAAQIAGQVGDIVVTSQKLDQNPLADALGPVKFSLDSSSLPDLSKIAAEKADQDRRREAAQAVVLNYAAQAIGGKGGNLINAYQNSKELGHIGEDIAKGLGGTLGEKVGGAFTGAGQGLVSDSALKLLGVESSSTGAAIGGAIGSFVPIPGGAFIGGAIGGIIGGLFQKTAKGSAGISVANGAFGAGSSSGSTGALAAQAAGLAGSVSDGLNSIAKQLGGLVSGSTDVKIGTYKGEFRVNDHGGAVGGVKGSGAVGFGTDEAAAIKFAIKAALDDGVISGIRESTKRILAAGKDLTAQLQKATDFESVFAELKQYTDPVGAAVDALDKQFGYLRSVFAEAGASTQEYADLESLYAFKRADAVKSASKDLTSTLQGLLDNLRYKGDSGLSLRTREKNAQAAFDPLAATVRGGGVVDQQAFTDAAQAYLDIERQLYGSTTTYFERLSDITALTGKAITNAGGTIQGGPIVANDNSPGAIAAALVDQTDALTIPPGSAALFTTGQFSDAVAAGLTIAAPQLSVIQPSNADVVDAINAQTAQLRDQTETMRAGFNLMISTTGKLSGGGGNAFSEGQAYTLRNA
ncbi:hypothetical protein [Sphingomonas oligophenolica]|uniref:Bacteriophage tail tape measure N-terminal domain-containing protein n=1 Tax=Sphingomonas oligophenolica TaxID=301154 RepID=A0A502CM07_9SPHN|nr:hypothetical protein [Sphingomonas oligophenolica]TPG13169.1 hypothetical protein EAH84_07150 [Sphingomonas oligophenolica]